MALVRISFMKPVLGDDMRRQAMFDRLNAAEERALAVATPDVVRASITGNVGDELREISARFDRAVDEHRKVGQALHTCCLGDITVESWQLDRAVKALIGSGFCYISEIPVMPVVPTRVCLRDGRYIDYSEITDEQQRIEFLRSDFIEVKKISFSTFIRGLDYNSVCNNDIDFSRFNDDPQFKIALKYWLERETIRRRPGNGNGIPSHKFSAGTWYVYPSDIEKAIHNAPTIMHGRARRFPSMDLAYSLVDFMTLSMNYGGIRVTSQDDRVVNA